MTSFQISSSYSPTDSDPSSVPFLSSLSYDGATPRSAGSNKSWDVAASCQPLLSTFRYLSSKLAFQGLHVAVIVLSSRPELLSAWPIDIHTQQFLNKLVSRADVKYTVSNSWVRAFSDLCRPVDAAEAFEVYRGTTYLVHRSLLQKDIIYSGDGLTVLAVDYIYKFKEHLASLALENTFPLFRDECKDSCIELLKHINDIYKDVPLSKAYLRRAYTYFELREEVLEEICDAYHAKYGNSNISDLTLNDSIISSGSSYGKPVVLIEQSEESPRKLPRTPKRNKSSKSFAARAGLDATPATLKMALGSPFEFDPCFNRPQTDAVERPRSPKGDLFESPRSVPVTPRKRSEERNLSIRKEIHALPFLQQNTDHTLDSSRFETASVKSTRRRKLLAPFLSMSRSGSVTSSIRNKQPNKTPSQADDPQPQQLPMIRCHSMTRNVPSFNPNREDLNRTHNFGYDSEINPPRTEFSNSSTVSSSASDSKFGWLHVVKKKAGWNMSLSQRVL